MTPQSSHSIGLADRPSTDTALMLHHCAMPTGVAGRGPRGGAENELGGDFRADYAAYVAAHGLRGMSIKVSGDERTHGLPCVIRAEVDEAVDDLEVTFTDGRRVLLQLKKSLKLTTANGSPLRKVIDQWVEQVTADPGGRTPLVALAATADDEIEHLAGALDRRRDCHAGLPSPSEYKALAKLTEALSQVTPEVRDALLARASVATFPWHARRGGPPVAAALLDGNVVAAGQGEAAASELAKAHRRSASLRTGLDLNQWIDRLGRPPFNLVSDSTASASARRVAERAAIDRYYQRIGGSSGVDLLAFGADLPLIDASICCDVRPSDGDSDRVDLDIFFRRYGRVLLLGAPGSGKSMALREIVRQEAERRWTLPVLVDLRSLLRSGDPGSSYLPDLVAERHPLEQLAGIAAEMVEPADRRLLIEAIHRAADEGWLLLCLDSLDETREHRREVVRWVRRLLTELHPDCDVLLATRTSAYASAAVLGWREATVLPPVWPRAISEPIVRAIARRTGRDGAWIGDRLREVDGRIRETPYLGETPLLVTALTLETAGQGQSAKHAGAAVLMDAVIRRVAHDWERRTGRRGVGMPALPSNQIEEALIDALATVGWESVTRASPPSERSVTHLLAGRFQTEHGLVPGVARALSGGCLDFWDEAGVLVRDDNGGIDPRARNVIEVSAARHLAESPEPVRRDLLLQAAADPSMTQILSLAVSLEPDLLIPLADVADRNDDVDLLLALARGISGREDAPERATAALIAKLGGKATAHGERAMDIVEAVARVPSPSGSREQIRILVRRVAPPEHLSTWEALLAHRWNEPHAFTACLSVAMSVPPVDDSDQPYVNEEGVLDLGTTSPHKVAFSEVVLAAAVRLATGNPDIAERIEEVAYHRCSHATFEKIQAVLVEQGYVPSKRGSRYDMKGMEDWAGRSRTARQWLLQRAQELGTQRSLKPVERRRLGNLGMLVSGLAFMTLEAGALERAIAADPANLSRMMAFVVQCGGIDKDALSSEATARLAEPAITQDLRIGLDHDLPSCRLTRWERTDVPATIAWLGTLFETTYLLARQAQLALAQAPAEHRPQASRHAEKAAADTTVPTRNRFLAAHLALFLDRDTLVRRWRHADNPVLLSAVMAWARNDLERPAILTEGLKHNDALVKLYAVNNIVDADMTHSGIVQALQEALRTELQATCQYCGLGYQDVRQGNCSQCKLALPNPLPAIKKALASRRDLAGRAQRQRH
ncbi:NACHT domain-containing protein [Micromonospora chalcea]|uniref:NACHT domain-containing protein n=1 Tax=Micromonospora chalcea TaxID=1874 RepID=UPI0033188CBA